MHYKCACDCSEPSHVPQICMWSFRTITCTTNMHVTVQNHHMHYKYACDRSEPSHVLEVTAYLGQMESDSAYMASVNKLVYHKYACEHSEPSHAPQICMWLFRTIICTTKMHMMLHLACKVVPRGKIWRANTVHKHKTKHLCLVKPPFHH